MGELLMLMVEDNPADVFFFQEALRDCRIEATVNVVEDGSDAMRFLSREPPYEDAARPDVLVLDLNLPVMNGREVLEKMAENENLRSIPVAILTTSTSERQLCSVYPGICEYFVKTDDFQGLQDIIRQIAQLVKAESR